MVIHVLLAMSVGVVFNMYSQENLSFKFLLFLGLLGVLPDIEHALFFFWYGRGHSYSKDVRYMLRSRNFYSCASYCKKNHKRLTSLYLHNGLVLLILVTLGIYYVHNHVLSASFFALASHYLFDVFEDVLINGKVNSNWYLKFGSRS